MGLSGWVFLRRAERDDLDTVVGWMEDPDFIRFLYGDPARSPQRIRERIVSMLGRSAGHTLPGAVYLVVDSDEHGPVGLISLQRISWRNRSCSIDVYIGNKGLRKGLVTTVSYYRALEYCFDELNLHRVAAFVYAFNPASYRMIERAGAVRELTLEEHVARDGELYDMYCYGILRPEFEAFRQEMAHHFPGKSLQEMIAARAGDSAGPDE